MGVEVLDAVVGPPQPHPHRDRFAAVEPLRHRPGVEGALVTRPPRRHITIRHHLGIERSTGVSRLSVTPDACGPGGRRGVRTAWVLWSVALREGEMAMEASTLEATPRLLLTIPEAARRLSVGRTTVYALLKSGELASVTIGRLRRIPTDSLEALLFSLDVAPSGVARTE